MSAIRRFREWREERARLRTARLRARAIASIRENMAFFGYPLDHLSDDEVERGVVEAQAYFHAQGMSADEFAEGLRDVAKIVGIDMASPEGSWSSRVEVRP